MSISDISTIPAANLPEPAGSHKYSTSASSEIHVWGKVDGVDLRRHTQTRWIPFPVLYDFEDLHMPVDVWDMSGRGTQRDPEGRPAVVKIVRPNSRSKDLSKVVTASGVKQDHPNVLPVQALFDLGSPDDGAFLHLISPWQRNGNVKEYQRRFSDQSNQGNANALNLVLGVAEGLQYLHKSEIIHGNLHPNNILIGDTGRPLLCDFGLATINDLIDPDNVVARARYVAPELVRGTVEQRTKECDVYAFGSVSSEIMTGVQPFAYLESNVDVTLALYHGILPFDRPERRLLYDLELDESLWEFLLQCWIDTPANRPGMQWCRNELRKISERNLTHASPEMKTRL